MNRREFISLIGGGAAAWPLAARAQQQMPVIGFLHSTSPDGYTDNLRAFRQGLKDTGHVEGENIAIEYRWAENQIDRLPALAADLVSRRVAVIVSGGAPASVSAAKATTTVSIVFMVPEDPIRLGLVTSLARPGGNLTGINFFAAELAAKRLELLRELVPGATRVAVLLNPTEATIAAANLRDVETAARAMGLQIHVLNARTSHEIDAAFATFVHKRPDALFISSGPFFGSRRVPTRGPGDLWFASISRSRRADELCSERSGRVAPGRSLYRPHPQGHKARGPAGRAVDQVRAGHQRPDGSDARSHRAAHAARARR
jgi:putative ABC transport system substrate-binding protein